MIRICSIVFVFLLLVSCDNVDEPKVQDEEEVVDTPDEEVEEEEEEEEEEDEEEDSSDDEGIDEEEKDKMSYPLPEDLPSLEEGKNWTYQSKFSNEFDASKTDTAFTNNWQDKFFNGWRGPDKTRYTPSRSFVENGELIFKAEIVGQTVETGCVSSKEMVSYPVYMEARVKISNSPLSTAVWMLSDDSTEEIDNLEAYGDVTNEWFSKRLHLSHHVFIRQPFQDYQPTGNATWYTDGSTVWSQDYHTYGVLWWGPFDLRYYVDGKEVRKTPEDEIDPRGYTNGKGLTKPMYLIISQAAQGWRESQGIDYLNQEGVTNSENTINRFDYIRTFKPE